MGQPRYIILCGGSKTNRSQAMQNLEDIVQGYIERGQVISYVGGVSVAVTFDRESEPYWHVFQALIVVK